ncbi:MAG: diphthine--ammonia ligase [Methanocellales archaeon]|nr:diphthine--ammonia ligase [Methanocellales archaeon]
MMKVAASWSGGKDSCFACYKAILDGFDVVCLLNFLSEDVGRSAHGLRAELLSIQSQAVEIPIIQIRKTKNNYEHNFKKVISKLKQDGIQGMVFGDIYVQEHRDWIEGVCSQIDIKPIFPLWRIKTEKIVHDFIDSGFDSVIVAIKAEILSEDWLGKKVDNDLIEEFKKRKIDPCGESGEYHTFVIDGPLFKKRLRILHSDKVLKERYWSLDISECDVIEK